MLRKLGKDLAVYGVADLLFKIAAFVVVPVYAHLLTVADFGLLSLLTISAALLGFIVNLGVNNAVHRFYFDPATQDSDRPVIVSTGFLQLLLVASLAVALGLLALDRTGEILRQYRIEWIWAALVLANVLPEQMAQYTLDTVRLHFTPWRFVAVSLIKNVLGILLGLWLLTSWNLGLTGIFLGTLIASTTAVPVGIWMIKRELTLRLNLSVARNMLHFGYPFAFASAAYWIFGSMDRWMLAEMSTPEEVGLFSLAFKFAAILSFVILAFGQAWGPYAMRMMREDRHYQRTYSAVLSGWFFLLALVGLALALFARELLMLLTPPDYWAAAPMLSIGTAGLVLFGTTQVTALGMTLTNRTLLLSLGAWLAALVNVGLNLLLIPNYGGTGSAVATLFSYAVLTGSFLYWTQRLHPLPLQPRKLLYSGGLVALAAVSPLFFTTEGIHPSIIGAKLCLLFLALGGGLAVGIIPADAHRQLLAELRLRLRQTRRKSA